MHDATSTARSAPLFAPRPCHGQRGSARHSGHPAQGRVGRKLDGRSPGLRVVVSRSSLPGACFPVVVIGKAASGRLLIRQSEGPIPHRSQLRGQPRRRLLHAQISTRAGKSVSVFPFHLARQRRRETVDPASKTQTPGRGKLPGEPGRASAPGHSARHWRDIWPQDAIARLSRHRRRSSLAINIK
jgi:hypothetical protein